MADRVHIVSVVGARPQFVKAAMIVRAIEAGAHGGGLRHSLLHTGQHYDPKMSEVFFDELDIPRPSVNLGIAGGLHGEMTGRMLEGIERELVRDRPDWLLVYGDTNSTLAGALAGVKLGVPVAHVEAGLRSFNRRMPEEINRAVADHVADVLFAPTDAAVENLRREGIAGERVVRTGDVMADAVMWYRAVAASRSTILATLGIESRGFVLATVHRQENTDDEARLASILAGLSLVSERVPVVLPLHPRTRQRIERGGLGAALAEDVRIIEPIGYLDMLRLESEARLIVTDSGGVQREASFHGVPCLALRDETEWTELVECGATVLVGADADRIQAEALAQLDAPTVTRPGACAVESASERILEELVTRHRVRKVAPTQAVES